MNTVSLIFCIIILLIVSLIVVLWYVHECFINNLKEEVMKLDTKVNTIKVDDIISEINKLKEDVNKLKEVQNKLVKDAEETPKIEKYNIHQH